MVGCGGLANVTTTSGDGFHRDCLLQHPPPLLLADVFKHFSPPTGHKSNVDPSPERKFLLPIPGGPDVDANVDSEVSINFNTFTGSGLVMVKKLIWLVCGRYVAGTMVSKTHRLMSQG